MKEKDSLIGQTVETMGGRRIRIKDQKNIGEEDVYTDEEGNIYTEEDLNLRYVLTPERILFDELVLLDIVCIGDWDFELYKKAVSRFMKGMEKAGYIERKGGEE